MNIDQRALDLTLKIMEAVNGPPLPGGNTQLTARVQCLIAEDLEANAPTPSSTWAAKGEPDPHGDRYNCRREELCMGDLTDDQLANGAFMNYDQPLDILGILAGTSHSPIAWMTAVKDRIRWLSRRVEAPVRVVLDASGGAWHAVYAERPVEVLMISHDNDDVAEAEVLMKALDGHDVASWGPVEPDMADAGVVDLYFNQLKEIA